LDKKPLFNVLLSATLFGLSTPLSKLLLGQVQPVVLAGLLYLGAFVGLSLYSLGRNFIPGKRPWKKPVEPPLRGKDFIWLGGAAVAGGILGPVCLLFGLARMSGFGASLLLNLEGAATALIAVILFRESAGRRVWLSLIFMTGAGVFLSWDPSRGRFAAGGALLILVAMFFWGLDNNFTRNIADKNPVQIARIKGLSAGFILLALAGLLGMRIPLNLSLVGGLGVGAFSYGLSLVLYIRALRRLGAFRAGLFFSFAPFIGALASLAILRESPSWLLLPGSFLMVAGVWLILREKHEHLHRHERLIHTHVHAHGDEHHAHTHDGPVREPHSHEHAHEDISHVHVHWPDIHHRHDH
jgi:drug/metabolite transporter (DMT)-like permease